MMESGDIQKLRKARSIPENVKELRMHLDLPSWSVTTTTAEEESTDYSSPLNTSDSYPTHRKTESLKHPGRKRSTKKKNIEICKTQSMHDHAWKDPVVANTMEHTTRRSMHKEKGESSQELRSNSFLTSQKQKKRHESSKVPNSDPRRNERISQITKKGNGEKKKKQKRKKTYLISPRKRKEKMDSKSPSSAQHTSPRNKFFNRLKKHAASSGGILNPSATKTHIQGKQSMVTTNADIIDRQLSRVSSEEFIADHLVKGGDHTLSPQEIEETCEELKARREIHNTSPLAFVSSNHSDDSSTEDVEQKKRDTIVRPLLIRKRSSTKNRHTSISSESSLSYPAKSLPFGKRQRSNSAIALTIQEARRHGSSDEWESEFWMFNTTDDESGVSGGRICLSPRESTLMRYKDPSEQRLCHKALFTVGGRMFLDGQKKSVYKDVTGLCIKDDDALVQGASWCTFTGARCTLKNIRDCQVLGPRCEVVDGERNFIRGQLCAVSGSGVGNVIHV